MLTIKIDGNIDGHFAGINFLWRPHPAIAAAGRANCRRYRAKRKKAQPQIPTASIQLVKNAKSLN